MPDHPKDLTDTGKELAAVAHTVRDEVTDAIEAAEKRGERRAQTETPRPATISSSELEAALGRRCDRCRAPGGDVGELWSEFKPVRMRMWMLVGAFTFLVAIVGYTMPRINHKLDAIDEMAKDMAALKVQVNFLIARPHASEDTGRSPMAQGVTP